MDSFFEQPRKLPTISTPQRTNEKILPVLMPDASLLLQNQGNVQQKTQQPMSYKAWKLQNYNKADKENITTISENKPIQQPSIIRKQVRFESPSLHQLKATHNNLHTPLVTPLPSAIKQSRPSPPKTQNVLHAKPFEKLYMANIPNRNLDLSIIEPQNRQCIKKQMLGVAESTRIEQPTNDDPTVKDLMKIIQQQNEQIVNLQKQVSTLLEERKEVAVQQPPKFLEPFNVFNHKKPQFAIDVMHSFEVSIRPPNNKKFNDYESKITELPSDNTISKPDVSLTLNEPVHVPENCPSPENSIHVDMQDFSSDEDDEDSVKLSVHNKVLDQVNYLLKKSQNREASKPKISKTTMQQIKDVTLKHLRSVGVTLPNIPDESLINQSDSNVQITPNEISFAVKQLLMKYLPSEHLAKVASPNKVQDITKENYPKNLITRRPDFSLATVQYMEKYNLLNKDGNVRMNSPKAQPENKLLDITALKQQPKLL